MLIPLDVSLPFCRFNFLMYSVKSTVSPLLRKRYVLFLLQNIHSEKCKIKQEKKKHINIFSLFHVFLFEVMASKIKIYAMEAIFFSIIMENKCTQTHKTIFVFKQGKWETKRKKNSKIE